MKKLSQFLLILTLSFPLFAQTDSSALINGKWDRKVLSDGAVWKSIHLTKNELFSSNQNINIIELSPNAKKVKLVLAYTDSLEKTSAIAKNRCAIAAINGSYFKMRGADPDHHSNLKSVPKTTPANIGRNRSVVYLKVKDSLISKQVYSRDSIRKRHQQGVVAIVNNDVSILKADTLNLGWEKQLIAPEIMSSGPVMLLSGKKQTIPNDDFCNDRHPRTAVGKKADGTVVLFIVDGRMPQAAGMSIIELQKTLRWLGCVDAINLDGGGSTTMYIKGQPFNGVVNYPTDNKKFDHEGEREVANVLLLIAN